MQVSKVLIIVRPSKNFIEAGKDVKCKNILFT